MMCSTSAANSSGRPSRGGNGTCAASDCLQLGGERRDHRRLEDAGRDGHHADAEARELARRGQRQPRHARLGRAVGRLPDLPVEGGNGSGVDDDAALASGIGRVALHRLRREPQHVEGADEIDLDRAAESCRGGAARSCPARARRARCRRSSPRRAARRTCRAPRRWPCATCDSSVTSAADEQAARAPARRQVFPLRRVDSQSRRCRLPPRACARLPPQARSAAGDEEGAAGYLHGRRDKA